jgi:hypothetical protein
VSGGGGCGWFGSLVVWLAWWSGWPGGLVGLVAWWLGGDRGGWGVTGGEGGVNGTHCRQTVISIRTNAPSTDIPALPIKRRGCRPPATVSAVSGFPWRPI